MHPTSLEGKGPAASAADLLQRRRAVLASKGRLRAKNPQALRHELHVHQIELEMQNQELRHIQLELAAARDRFIDLYEFAPVGYLTLDRDGWIVELNQTSAAMLGGVREALRWTPFDQLIGPADRERWQRHFQGALTCDELSHIELALQPWGGTLVYGQVDCLRVVPADAAPTLRVTLTDITARKQAEAGRRIAAALVASREAERRRVAHQLNEELGQRLSALKMNLSCLRPGDLSGDTRALGAIQAALSESIAMVRRLASELRPPVLDDLGLNAAIDWLVQDSARRLGLDISLRVDEGDPPLGDRHSTAVYRLLQETLAHIGRFARATDVSIEMLQMADELIVSVQDNGIAWAEASNRYDDAVDAMPLREQVQMLNGRLAFDEVPGGGQRLTIRLPFAPVTTAAVPPPVGGSTRR